MASIRDHLSHHDDPGALPLVTESARVVDVTALDHNRTGELRFASAKILDTLERENLVTGSDPPHIDWNSAENFLSGADGGLLLQKLAHLKERYDRAYPSLLSFRLREEETPLDFVPGQYVTIRFHDTPRPYPIASSPNRDYLEICLRRVPEGRLTSDLFEDLEAGDEVTLRGPNGDFVMDDPSSRDMAFLATGTGVAPFKSMIQYTFEKDRDRIHGEPREIWLFLGCSWEDNLPYRDEFRDLASNHDNFHFVPTLSREQYLTDWDGETAYAQQTFMNYLVDGVDASINDGFAAFLDEEPCTDIEARIDPGQLEVYACGVSPMVETLVEVVQQVGVPEQHVQAEGYG